MPAEQAGETGQRPGQPHPHQRAEAGPRHGPGHGRHPGHRPHPGHDQPLAGRRAYPGAGRQTGQVTAYVNTYGLRRCSHGRAGLPPAPATRQSPVQCSTWGGVLACPVVDPSPDTTRPTSPAPVTSANAVSIDPSGDRLSCRGLSVRSAHDHPLRRDLDRVRAVLHRRAGPHRPTPRRTGLDLEPDRSPARRIRISPAGMLMRPRRVLRRRAGREAAGELKAG